MLKYKDVKDAMERCKLLQQENVVVNKSFYQSVLEEVVRKRRKTIAKSRQGSKLCTSK